MEGRRRRREEEEEEEEEEEGDESIIRKGPWKAEEDQVLLNHVNKCGARDWSSIQSKGLLRRTGKSCRLRWVNKLRPNLKNGCKFSQEEERVVIELQAEFGNKWAKIATYLPGRTDNDVKNFWSSRRKRLARIFHTSTSTPSKSHKNKMEEVPKLICSAEGESSCSSTCIVNSVDEMKMVPLPEDLKDSKLLALEAIPLQNHLPPSEKYLWIQADLDFSSETQQLLREDPYFDMFGPLAPELAVEPPLLGCGNVEEEKIDNAIIPDCVFDDFPADMFDQIEQQPPNLSED